MTDKPKAGLSLADFTLDDEADYEIKNKLGEPSGWVWTFSGPGHPATVAADERQAKRQVQIEEDIEKARANGRKWKGSGDTFEERRDRNIAYIVARLLRWSDGMTDGDKPFACTPDNARKVLLNPGLNVYEQVNGYLTDEKSFTPRSAKN